MKQIFLPILATMIIIAGSGIYYNKQYAKSGDYAFLPSTLATSKEAIKLGDDTIVFITLADTPEERAKGLSGTTSLRYWDGMFFVFEEENTTPSFWMKDMLYALDLVWIKDGIIVQINKNVPPPVPGTPDSELPLYTSNVPIDAVLELIGGFCDQQDIKVGDKVTI